MINLISSVKFIGSTFISLNWITITHGSLQIHSCLKAEICPPASNPHNKEIVGYQKGFQKRFAVGGAVLLSVIRHNSAVWGFWRTGTWWISEKYSWDFSRGLYFQENIQPELLVNGSSRWGRARLPHKIIESKWCMVLMPYQRLPHLCAFPPTLAQDSYIKTAFNLLCSAVSFKHKGLRLFTIDVIISRATLFTLETLLPPRLSSTINTEQVDISLTNYNTTTWGQSRPTLINLLIFLPI